jgi:heavy metal sensor kinase
LKNHSLKRRLLASYAVVLALIILLFGNALIWGLNENLNSKLHTSLESVVYDIKHDLLSDLLQSGIIDTKEFVISPVYIEVWQIAKGEKRRLFYSENLTHANLPILSERSETFKLIEVTFISDDDKSAVLSMPVTVQGQTYLISAATPIDKIDDMIEDFLKIAALSGILLYLAALYLGYRMIDQVFSPMQSIIRTADMISQKNLSMRVPLPQVKDEFFMLAQTFNTMLERIEHAFEQVKRFNVNVSHELKTPLTIIHGEAEVALLKERKPKEYRDVLQSIMEETSSMHRIVESMLLLSKSDTGALKKRMIPVVLNDLVSEVIAHKKAQADAKSIKIILQDSEPVTVLAEPELLRQALINLIDNAIKYTPEAEEKTITILLYKHENVAFIEIIDEGIGISEAQLPYLFEPFYRAEDSRAKTIPGYGLGLSIAKWIADLHNATLLIKSNRSGTKVRMSFITA